MQGLEDRSVSQKAGLTIDVSIKRRTLFSKALMKEELAKGISTTVLSGELIYG